MGDGFFSLTGVKVFPDALVPTWQVLVYAVSCTVISHAGKWLNSATAPEFKGLGSNAKTSLLMF